MIRRRFEKPDGTNGSAGRALDSVGNVAADPLRPTVEDPRDMPPIDPASPSEFALRHLHLRQDPHPHGKSAPGQHDLSHAPAIMGESPRVNSPGCKTLSTPMTRPPTLLPVDTGERFRALRKALGLSTAEVAKRTGGLLDRRVVERIESGAYKLSSDRQRRGLSVAYGLSRAEIDALIQNELTVDTAIAIAKGKTPEVPFPTSRASGTGARSTEALGEQMATAIAMRQSELARFPNLEFCLEYHKRNGKTWDASVIAAARAGHFGEHDLPTTGAWDSALDRLQAVMRHATIEAGNAPRPKPLGAGTKEKT